MRRLARGGGILLWFAAMGAWGDFDSGLFAYSMGNYAEAAREFEASARRGEPQGEYYLGLLYEEGQGLARDYALARQWYLKAADRGDIDAAFALGRIHAQGLGLPRDLAAAYMWYSRATLGGHYLGRQERDRCAALMTPEQLEQARALLRK